MVLNKFGDHLYNSLVATITKHLQGITVLVEQTQGGPFLEELNKRWCDHNKSMQMIRGESLFRCVPSGLLGMPSTNRTVLVVRVSPHTQRLTWFRAAREPDILMYMDRTYVPQHQKMPVHELGLKLWHDHVVRAPLHSWLSPPIALWPKKGGA
jgi:cullin 3